MPIIKDKEKASNEIRLGIEEAERLGTTLNELADRIGVADGTLKTWMYSSSIPRTLDDGKFFGLIWLVMRHTALKRTWVENLLQATSIPIFIPISLPLMRAYFLEGRLNGVGKKTTQPSDIKLDGEPIPIDDIDFVLASIFDPENAAKTELGEEGHLPGSHFMGKYLEGEFDVITYLDYLHRLDLKEIMRSVVYGAIKSPERLGELLVGYIAEQKRMQKLIIFKVVLVLPPDVINDVFLKSVDERLETYRKHDVLDRLDLRILLSNQPVGMDVVTVDDKHLILTLADQIGQNRIYKATIVKNLPSTVRTINYWFDTAVVPQSIPFDDL